MRFLIGLAALTYTATQVHPLLWFFLFLGGVLVVATVLAFWPLLMVLIIVVGGFWLARQVLAWDARRKERNDVPF